MLDNYMEIMGYPVYISELCSGVMFGAWSQMILAYWFGLDIMTDPLVEIYDNPIFTKNRIQGQWTGAEREEAMSKLAQAV